MAILLVGEVVNNCDTTTGFNVGNVSTDDDQVQGAGAIGAKVSATYQPFFTTSLGATAPYAFQSGGSKFGWHIIMYFGAKSPLQGATGQRIIVGNGTSQGEWYVPLKASNEPKFAIFASRVIDAAAAFDRIALGSWTLGGNPGQLTSITNMGGGLDVVASLMGNFNNAQIDQITIGLGVRADGGTANTPNTFETVRAQDEGTSKWGWWSSVVGKIVAKGKLYIGPATGTAVSVFNDTAFSVVFADERVATAFYEIAMRGTNTDVTWTLANISRASLTSARWAITVDSTTKTFVDTNGVWSGARSLVLNSTTTLNGTTIVDSAGMVQNSATLNSITVLSPSVTAGVAFLSANNPALISGCEFDAGSAGHAIVITTPGTYSFVGNKFTGYSGAAESTSAAVYNNSGGAVTLNVSGGGDSPTVRNGAGATTSIVNAVTFTITGLVDNSEVRIYRVSDDVELFAVENSSGGSATYAYNAAGTVPVYIHIHHIQYVFIRLELSLGSTDASVPVQQRFDRAYSNPA